MIWQYVYIIGLCGRKSHIKQRKVQKLDKSRITPLEPKYHICVLTSSIYEFLDQAQKYKQSDFLYLTLQPPNYVIGIFTHLKLCLGDEIHNFK